jgi:starch phosphorylase
MCDYIVKRYKIEPKRMHQGATQQEVSQAESVFDAGALTLGFARRFATYKRPNLLLHDPERLVRILTDRKRPVQLILAGKAHPQDASGQAMIKQWSDFILRPDVRSSVAFLSDYDLLLTSHLVQGVDLWLNTPRRPWEASGTSGMKVLVNGGLNLSELDGWWAEAYSPEVGWAIGDGREHDDDKAWDAHEAEELYDLLEKEIVPAFYSRDDQGIPKAWVTKMRASMLQLTPKFSSNRSVREYVENYYLSAAKSYRERVGNGSQVGVDLSNWLTSVTQMWSNIKFGTVNTRLENGQIIFEVQVFFGGFDPDDTAVELYAESENARPFCQRMHRVRKADRDYILYSTRVPAGRPASDYTPRVIPCNPKALLPLESAQILWSR